MTGQDSFQKEHRGIADEGFTADDYADAIRLLRVLKFFPDTTGRKIMSEIDGKTVYLDWNYSYIRVKVDETWLCSVELLKGGTTYIAKPLQKITYSAIMGLSDDISNSIIDRLWEDHGDKFVTTFTELYKDKVASETREAVKAEYESTIEDLNDKIRYLSGQLTRSNMVIRGMGDPQYDGVELTSEDIDPFQAAPAPARTSEEPRPAKGADAPKRMFRSANRIPGMPEIQRPDSEPELASYIVKAERLNEETIRCEGLRDGKYFVHITPSGEYIVVRPNEYGQVVCVRQCLYLSGLNRFMEFEGREELVGEYSPYYGGLVIYLDGTKQQPSESGGQGQEGE